MLPYWQGSILALFLPTPSVRRATPYRATPQRTQVHFYPRPP